MTTSRRLLVLMVFGIGLVASNVYLLADDGSLQDAQKEKEEMKLPSARQRAKHRFAQSYRFCPPLPA